MSSAKRDGDRGRVQPLAVKPARITALVIEFAIVVLAVMVYFFVRGLTEGSHAEAVANAQDIVDVERWLGIWWEPAAQDLIDGHHWLVTAVNWVYVYGHWPVIVVVGTWMYVRHPAAYYRVRNGCLFSGVVGIVVFAVYPVAPPRLAGLGLVDTLTEYSRGYRILQPPALVNQYAAMPSLHFGWNLLISGAIVLLVRSPWVRAAAVALAVAMCLAVVLTANHFILDVVAGAALAPLGVVAAVALERARLPHVFRRALWGRLA